MSLNNHGNFENEEQKRGLTPQKWKYSPKIQCGIYEKTDIQTKRIKWTQKLSPCTGEIDCLIGNSIGKNWFMESIEKWRK